MWISITCHIKKISPHRNTGGILPSVFRGSSRYIVKFNFPANSLFICLHSYNFASVPLFIDTYFNQQTLICRKENINRNTRTLRFLSFQVICDKGQCREDHFLTLLDIFSVVLCFLRWSLLRFLLTT